MPPAVLAGLSLVFAWSPVHAEEASPPEPQSYRMQDYRAPTPATLSGARGLTTAEAAELWRSGAAVFIDVLPQAPRPANLPEGTLWRDKPRSDIPGSIWLPDTGYGALNPAMEEYLRINLDRAAGTDRSKTLVFYCLKDCWMSWNAAKRALGLGFPRIAWYPDGTDGWTAAGLPVEPVKPLFPGPKADALNGQPQGPLTPPSPARGEGECASRCNIVPSPLAGEGQDEGD